MGIKLHMSHRLLSHPSKTYEVIKGELVPTPELSD